MGLSVKKLWSNRTDTRLVGRKPGRPIYAALECKPEDTVPRAPSPTDAGNKLPTLGMMSPRHRRLQGFNSYSVTCFVCGGRAQLCNLDVDVSVGRKSGKVSTIGEMV